MKKLLTGNEAVARGFYEAGGAVASAYPGTPSTEILENISGYKDEVYCEWAPNEKVAVETAVGASVAGARSLAAMKHVGLNVAADPLFTFSYVGVNGGCVIVSADDPELHSSQNEQDNRHYARAAKLCMLEPADSQEALDMVKAGYEISEKFDVPVLLRMTTRVCHSKSLVTLGERERVPMKPYARNRAKYDAIPAIARKLHTKVEARQRALAEYAETCPFNYVVDNGARTGVIADGVAYQYARDTFGDGANYLKLGFSYPLPLKLIKDFASKVDKLYVIEELDPFIEEQLKAAGVDCIGKAVVPMEGELNPSILREAIFGEKPETVSVDSPVVPRAPALCAGCPHRGIFLELGKHKDAIFSGDIGCYSLSGGDPYNAKDTGVCMGASISMAHGMKKAFDQYGQPDKKVIAVIGDSTFFHTGVNSLIDIAYNGSTALTVILDNRITGMTGHQENPGTGYTLMGTSAPMISIEALVRAIGIKNVAVVNPLDLKACRDAISWGLAQKEPAVIITRYPCALKKYSPEDTTEFGGLSKCSVDSEKCIGCRACIRTGCPALAFDKAIKKVTIDRLSCTGCTICAQVCPVGAIGK